MSDERARSSQSVGHRAHHLGVSETNTLDGAERWAAEIGGPAYALDDQSAITVVDGIVEVVSEGEWRRFNR